MNTIDQPTLPFWLQVKHRTISLLVGFPLQWHKNHGIDTVSNPTGGSHKSTFSRSKTYGEATMDKVQFECRICKKITVQLIHKITDNLPEGVEVIQCTKCEVMGVAQIGDSNANL
jgi:hypothetical protein